MKIALAPDSFKGSLSAPDACRALQRGAERVFPNAEFVQIPLADGGEGTLDALLAGAGGRVKTQVVRGPLGDAVEARWGILPDGRALIEMAQASGLDLVEPRRRDALKASSFGTGQLIKAALDAGCRTILLAIGGSATTDGGVGALNALGLSTRDKRDRALPPGGAALAELAQFDLKFWDARLAKTEFTVLCDVDNSLYGASGAAHVYAAQKGATGNGQKGATGNGQIEQLDDALRHYAAMTQQFIGQDYSGHAGAGAAGGVGFGMLAFCNAQMKSGIEVILDAVQFAEKISQCDLILTGEGALDAQTLNGKTVAGVCRLARQHHVPTIALGGIVELSDAQMDELGLISAFSLTNGPQTLDFCVNNASELLTNSTERILRLWKFAQSVSV